VSDHPLRLPILKKFINNRFFIMIPAQMVVLLVAVPLGMYFDLSHEHTYSWGGTKYSLDDSFVNVPNDLLAAMAHPDFSVFAIPICGRRRSAGW
jgi:hypothetical protein